ncbi:MAG: hypothetical protein RSE94_02200 [Pseudomonas sp.]
MAVISSVTTRDKAGDFPITPTELVGTNTLEYNPAAVQTFYVRNGSASPVTLVIDGAGVTTAALPGQGKPIDNSAGYSLTVAAGATRAVVLSSIRNFLIGVVSVTGGAASVQGWVVEG